MHLVLAFVCLALAPTWTLAQNDDGLRGGGGNGNGNGNGGFDRDPQKSRILDPRVIGSNFANDGQDEPTPGQVPSLTSTNNFINFCLTLPGVPITNGQQIQTGSCNPIPIGAIPSTDKMPSSKFVFPPNFGTLKANEAFTIRMAVRNLVTGNFVNAQKSYFAAPQQLDRSGTILGHSHVVIERITSLRDTTPTNPKVFEFFKGLNGGAQGGVLTADVTKGLPAGAYRLASINTAANHQPAIVPIAQHGSLDDMIYFEVTESGQTTPIPPGATNSPQPSPSASSTVRGSPSTTRTASATGTAKPSTSAKPTNSGTKTSTVASSSAPAPTNTGNSNPNRNLQKFTKALLGVRAPAVFRVGRMFIVERSRTFASLTQAIRRSCEVQRNQCVNRVRDSRDSRIRVSDCERQERECRAAN